MFILHDPIMFMPHMPCLRVVLFSLPVTLSLCDRIQTYLSQRFRLVNISRNKTRKIHFLSVVSHSLDSLPQMTKHILLMCSLMFLPYSLQFYLKSKSDPMTEDTKWGLNILEKEENLKQLEILRSFISDDINLSRKKIREADDVHFSITNSLDVLRERMLGAIRRNNRKTEVIIQGK